MCKNLQLFFFQQIELYYYFFLLLVERLIYISLIILLVSTNLGYVILEKSSQPFYHFECNSSRRITEVKKRLA